LGKHWRENIYKRWLSYGKGEVLLQEQVQQAISDADPDGTYRKQIGARTLDKARVIGGRENGIKDELLAQGYTAVYEVEAFPCARRTFHMPDFIVLERRDKNTGKTYTVTAPDGRLVLWDPHGEFKDKGEENKYGSFYYLYHDIFEITIFTQNAHEFQRKLAASRIKVADRVISAPNQMGNKQLAEVRAVTRKELDRLVLREDGSGGSIAQLKLIQCLKEAKRPNGEAWTQRNDVEENAPRLIQKSVAAYQKQ
jgi:hypothetical protein